MALPFPKPGQDLLPDFEGEDEDTEMVGFLNLSDEQV
jgi:hypothetical protein